MANVPPPHCPTRDKPTISPCCSNARTAWCCPAVRGPALEWLAGFEDASVENIAAVITRARATGS